MNDIKKSYTKVNSQIIDEWCKDGWVWGQPIHHEQYQNALKGHWQLFLTPHIPVPQDWYPPLKGTHVLGLASGGGQQMPILASQGAICTVMDYSLEQLKSERMVSEREGYEISIVHGDMSQPLPFENESFDFIFHPVSNVYIEDVQPLWEECYRVLKKGGILVAGLDNSIQYAFDDDGLNLVTKLPYNPLKDKTLLKQALEQGDGIQFSHTIEEQIGGQLKAGFILQDIYQDTCSQGPLYTYQVPVFYATKAKK